MSIAMGFTWEEVRELVHQYSIQPYGTKMAWLVEQGIGKDRMRRWRAAVFEGELDRGLVPREAGAVDVPNAKRTSIERQRAAERAAHAAELDRLRSRVSELEQTNEALGKAIGLLHQLNEQEPDVTSTPSGPDGSSAPRTT